MGPANAAYALVQPRMRSALQLATEGSGWSGRDLFFVYYWTYPSSLLPWQPFDGHPAPPPVPDPLLHWWTVINYEFQDVRIGGILVGRRLHFFFDVPLFSVGASVLAGNLAMRRRYVARRGRTRWCGFERLVPTRSAAFGSSQVTQPSTEKWYFFAVTNPFFDTNMHWILTAQSAFPQHQSWSYTPIFFVNFSKQICAIATPERVTFNQQPALLR